MIGSVDLEVRVATDADLDAIVALTGARRDRLAAWSPAWWAKAAGADEIHPLWLGHLVSTGAFRVVTGDGAVVACAAMILQGDRSFVDDLAVAEVEIWDESVALLTESLQHRPSVTCLAPQEVAGAVAVAAAGWAHVSSYWVGVTRGAAPGLGPLDPASAQAARPVHSFAVSGFDASAEGALAFSTSAGSVVGSPSVPAPPVYDPGGTVAVVDHLAGPALDELVEQTLGAARDRGDARLAVVCGTDDGDLAAALADAGLTRTVDVYGFALDPT